MPWVCASTYPRTSWMSVTPACGRPVTSTSTSGYAAQPAVRRSAKAVGLPPSRAPSAVRVSPQTADESFADARGWLRGLRGLPG